MWTCHFRPGTHALAILRPSRASAVSALLAVAAVQHFESDKAVRSHPPLAGVQFNG